MKKMIGIMMTVVLMAAVLSGCGSSPQQTAGLSGSVSANGSTSMDKVVGILSEQFMNDNPDVTVTYDATGSGTGIEAVANGTCDIGLASRPLKEEEKAKGLSQTTIALDGIAIIVNESCPVEDLSVEQIASVFTGKINDWEELGGNGEIVCIGREAGSGTRDGFESMTKTTDKCLLKQELTSTGAVITAVQNNQNAIGYASLAAAEGQTGIKILAVGGVPCSADNITNGSYAIQRPFNLITRDDGTWSEAAQAFFDYMVSAEAAQLITEAGAVPTAK